MNRSPMSHIDNNEGKLSNSNLTNGLNMGHLAIQRSRHNNSIKHSSSLNLSNRLKAKTTKNSKSKKKNHSYQKTQEFKPSKHSHNRSPQGHYDFSTKSNMAAKMSNLSNVKCQNQESHFRRKNSAKYSRDSQIPPKDKSCSRERGHVSQERMSKRENGKQQIVNFIGKYIQQANEVKVDQGYDDTLNNLKDFLGYLEDKNIINGQQLESKNQVQSLIKDLMKLDLTKFHNLRKAENTNKHKGGSRNVNVSVNRSNSVNQHQKNEHNKSDNNGRKTHSVHSKNIYRVVGGHGSENSEDFKSSRRLSYCPDEENKAACYQALRSSNQTPKGIESIAKANEHHNANYRTPLNDHTNYQPKRFEVNNRGKTAPSSATHSKERVEIPENLKNHLMSRQKSSQSNANILKSNSNQVSLPEGFMPNTGLVNPANGLPKRSGSQKIRGNSHHFMKRKDGVMSIDAQNQDINKVLKDKTDMGRVNDPNNSNDDKGRTPVAKEKQGSIDSDNQCQLIEQGVDKVTFNIKVKDDILSEREHMIKAIKIYIKKHKRLPPTTLDYYKFVKLVGKGAFGKVTLGIHKLTGKQVAIKTIDKSYMKDDFSRKKVLQEVYILKNIKHSNVIRLLEVFESPKHLLIVMEFSGGGDLLKYIKKNGRLNENRTREYFIQIVHGLAHCH